jgi:hypothetical protein
MLGGGVIPSSPPHPRPPLNPCMPCPPLILPHFELCLYTRSQTPNVITNRISCRFVLTAAHCLDNVEIGRLKMRLGNENLDTRTENEVERTVVEAHQHPDFRKVKIVQNKMWSSPYSKRISGKDNRQQMRISRNGRLITSILDCVLDVRFGCNAHPKT